MASKLTRALSCVVNLGLVAIPKGTSCERSDRSVGGIQEAPATKAGAAIMVRQLAPRPHGTGTGSCIEVTWDSIRATLTIEREGLEWRRLRALRVGSESVGLSWHEGQSVKGQSADLCSVSNIGEGERGGRIRASDKEGEVRNETQASMCAQLDCGGTQGTLALTTPTWCRCRPRSTAWPRSCQ